MSKILKHAIQDDYADDFAWCYGCGRLNEDGLQLRTGWDGKHTVTYYTPREHHIAVPGFVYGGLIASLVDCHGTGSASLYLHRKNGHEPGDQIAAPRMVTASLQVNYLEPTPKNTPLKAVGRVEEIHPKRYSVQTKVYAGERCCVEGEVVAVVMPDTFKK